MSYHKFTNLGETFQGDLPTKLAKNILSKDFMERECNCNKRSLGEGKCAFGGHCRACVVVYKATCKKCGLCYVGNTQQPLKTRMSQHFTETRRLVNNGTPADSFAAHFATHFKESEKVSVSQVRALVGMEVMWKGNPITCMKSFGTHNCALCMRERISILTLSRKSPEQLIKVSMEMRSLIHRAQYAVS